MSAESVVFELRLIATWVLLDDVSAPSVVFCETAASTATDVLDVSATSVVAEVMMTSDVPSNAKSKDISNPYYEITPTSAPFDTQN